MKNAVWHTITPSDRASHESSVGWQPAPVSVPSAVANADTAEQSSANGCCVSPAAHAHDSWPS